MECWYWIDKYVLANFYGFIELAETHKYICIIVETCHYILSSACTKYIIIERLQVLTFVHLGRKKTEICIILAHLVY